MADFCKECSINMFGQDFKELAFEGDPDEFRAALCESCGYIYVNRDGIKLPDTDGATAEMFPLTLDPETLKWKDKDGIFI